MSKVNADSLEEAMSVWEVFKQSDFVPFFAEGKCPLVVVSCDAGRTDHDSGCGSAG